jgi:uncharacterized protein YdcH (DUF465 family)
MGFADTEALKQHLVMTDPHYADLVTIHQGYEKRLGELASLHYPSAEEQMEEATLKKKKLVLKDEMETILRRYREQQQAAGR